ncbi:NUDIX hydrolase [Phytopseudomonas argentinensis]|uniref:NUDIX hydrolase n=1 Tax=Phytopseudomonas argentinensis TaxID=289370 RepID=UPI003CC50387
MLVVSPARRILLFRFAHASGALNGSSYWATPGGAVEEGETFASAALRELLEETGIRAPSLGEPVGFRRFEMRMSDGEVVEALEHYFYVRAATEEVCNSLWTTEERAVIAEHRWWTLDDLPLSEETIWPERLTEMVARALAA